MKTDLYNLKNEKVGTVEVPDKVFGATWKPALVRQVLLAQQANAREPWAHAKTRAEVRGGGKKPWRQKGTGRARHGSTRSPIWVGGGKAHGPNKERDYSQKVNKTMRRSAFLSVLSRKLKQGEIKFIDSLKLEVPKTKLVASALRRVLEMKPKTLKYNVLLIPDTENTSIFRAARNLPKTKVLGAASLNVYDMLNHKHILIDREAVVVIEKTYSK